MMFSLNPGPNSTESNSCLCHSDGIKGPLTSVTDVSWKTLEVLAFLQEDSIYKNMEGRWDLSPFGGYHRSLSNEYG